LSPTFINGKINDRPQINLIEGDNKNGNEDNQGLEEAEE
jgi:hypothetical protein